MNLKSTKIRLGCEGKVFQVSYQHLSAASVCSELSADGRHFLKKKALKRLQKQLCRIEKTLQRYVKFARVLKPNISCPFSELRLILQSSCVSFLDGSALVVSYNHRARSASARPQPPCQPCKPISHTLSHFSWFREGLARWVTSPTLLNAKVGRWRARACRPQDQR